jgi:hypothetical protein
MIARGNAAFGNRGDGGPKDRFETEENPARRKHKNVQIKTFSPSGEKSKHRAKR